VEKNLGNSESTYKQRLKVKLFILLLIQLSLDLILNNKQQKHGLMMIS